MMGEEMKRLIIKSLYFYQKYLSPLKKASCRFTPTCSQYAIDAVEKYGTIKGMWMALCRLCRCHPFHPGGYDPVDNCKKEAN